MSGERRGINPDVLKNKSTAKRVVAGVVAVGAAIGIGKMIGTESSSGKTGRDIAVGGELGELKKDKQHGFRPDVLNEQPVVADAGEEDSADVGFGGEDIETQEVDEFKEMTETFRGFIEAALGKKMNVAKLGDIESLKVFRPGELYTREGENVDGETQLVVKEAVAGKNGKRIPHADKVYVTITKHEDGSYTLEDGIDFTVAIYEPESDEDRLPGGMMEDMHQTVAAYSVTGDAQEVGSRVGEAVRFDDELRGLQQRAQGNPKEYARLAKEFKEKWKNIFVDPLARQKFDEDVKYKMLQIAEHNAVEGE